MRKLLALAIVFGGALLAHASAAHRSIRTSTSLRFINLKSCLKMRLLCLTFFLAPIPLFAAQVSTTTTLAISPSDYVAAGTVVTLTATVTNTGSVTSGTVNFCNTESTDCSLGSGLYGSVQLTSAGTAIIHRVFGYGNNSIKAVFLPTTLNAGSTSPTNAVTVTASPIYASSTTLGAAGSAGNYTLSGTVTAFGKQSLTGMIDFLDTTSGNLQIGTTSLNIATSAFTNQATYTTGDGPSAVAVGDFNGDGKLDLIVTNYSSGTVSVLLGNGDGTFQSQVVYATDSNVMSVAVGDFNNDGKLDLVVTNSVGVSVLLGNGDGTFQPQIVSSIGGFPWSVAVGDFNGDGKLDLAVQNVYGYVSVLLGNGDGTFRSPVLYSAGGDGRNSVVVGDFRGNGKLDLAVVTGNYDFGLVSILLGNGDGTFQAQVGYVAGNFAYHVALGDFNGDGRLDLAVANTNDNTVSILLGNGDGTFQTQLVYPTGSGPSSVAVGDFNADGKLDLVVTNGTGNTVSNLLGNGDGTFQPQVIYATGSSPSSVAVGDFNGDGKLDLAITNSSSNTVSLLLGEQIATYSESGIAVYGSGTHSVLASYGGDGSRTSSQSSTVALTAIKAIPSITVSCSPNPTAYSQISTCTVTVSGEATGTIGFYYNGNNWANTTLSGGSASASGFNTLPVGSYSIVANYSGDANNYAASSSTTLTIDKATPVLSLSSSANPAVYGNPVTFTAQYGASATGTVTFYDGATVLGTSSLTDGVATYATTSLKGGSHSITVQYAGDSNYTAAVSTVLAEVISTSAAIPTITSTINPSTFGVSVTFTFSYAGVAGFAIPTGSVAITDGASPLTTLTLDATGKATYTTFSLVAGTHSITSVYGGDSNYQ